jgi:pimeloyl-ACP methyl ester carboxylesterase
VDDLAAAIRERWAGPVVLLGISYGGILAAWLTIRHPQLVGRLVFIASARRFSSEGEQRIRRQIAFAGSRNFSGFLSDFGAVFRRPWLNALVWLRINLGRTSLAEGMNDADIIVSYLSAILEAGTPPTQEIKVPTLMIGGSNDQFFGEGMMEETARSIADARLELLHGETHMAPVERANEVAIAIGKFIG